MARIRDVCCLVIGRQVTGKRAFTSDLQIRTLHATRSLCPASTITTSLTLSEYAMPSNRELDAEFDTIMGNGRSIPHPSMKTVPPSTSGLDKGGFAISSNSGNGPRHVHPSVERATPQQSVQMVRFHSDLSPFPHFIDPPRTKKYDTVVKGFKILEVSYEGAQKNLALAEERLSTMSVSYEALVAEMGAAQQVLHDREMVW